MPTRKGATLTMEHRANISAALTGPKAADRPRRAPLSEEARERKRQWKRDHRDQVREASRDYYRRRGQHLWRSREYGLTREEFEAMCEAQGNSCAICAMQFGGTKGTAPHVDHDHATGRVRALLCGNCNFVIGYSHEDQRVLVKAARYLRLHRRITG